MSASRTRRNQSDSLPSAWYRAVARASRQLCSARKTLAAFCLSLPARNERGESRREGKLIKSASSPRPSPPFLRRRGRENAVARSKQNFCRTQLASRLPKADIQPARVLSRVPSLSSCPDGQAGLLPDFAASLSLLCRKIH